MNQQPLAIFDLDGTLRDTGAALYPRAGQVTIYAGVRERLMQLRQAGYLLAGVTNQGGVRRGLISVREVAAALDRTQQLLGDARLDVVLHCPHDMGADDFCCDCKKPAPGMVLEVLRLLPQSTLDGAFVVGDSTAADGGMARCLALPFLHAEAFRHRPVAELLAWAARQNPPVAAAPGPDRVAGTLVGMAAGDALGAPLEFHSRQAVRGFYPQPLREMIASARWAAGEYTDDTQMALLIADSLLAHGALDAADIAHRFRLWSHISKDVGIQTSAVLHADGYPDEPEAVAMRYYESHPHSSAGNGAVMRCAPVALFRLHSLPQLLADSRRSARITHADPRAQSACVILNAWIRQAILHGTRDARGPVLEMLTPLERQAWHRLESIEHLDEAEINSGGYTVSTLEAAAWSFLTTSSFEEAVVRAANLGHDADTVAAVTGALAGAYYGYNAIPQRWRDQLRDQASIRRTALRLAGAA